MPIRASLSGARRRRAYSNIVGWLCVSGAIIAAALILGRQSPQVEAREPQPQVVAQFDTLLVPVPLEAVSAGVRVSDIKTHLVTFPAHQVPAGAITDLTPFKDSLTTSPLPASLPLFEENLSSTGLAKNPVIDRIPPGMRAMTVKVDATSAVEGWAGSGAFVDVLLVQNDRTSVVAENVKILSAERKVAAVDGAASPNVPSTVTLLVTQEQCLAINTAIPLGRIAFALRGGRDRDTWDQTMYSAEALKSGSSKGTAKEEAVRGYISVKEGRDHKSFALSGDKWVATEVIPEGFMVNNNERNLKEKR